MGFGELAEPIESAKRYHAWSAHGFRAARMRLCVHVRVRLREQESMEGGEGKGSLGHWSEIGQELGVVQDEEFVKHIRPHVA
jgi:hypothetical protein